MLFRAFLLFLSFLLSGFAPLCAAPHRAIPSGPIPNGLGINIHFTEALPGEMEMLAATGVKWIRMDWGWGRTERVKGIYDFSEPDKLVAQMEKHGLRAIFVLSYGNKLYSPVSPATDESRQAFARWAVAAVTHFRGRGILWEMWNEPNLFWTPKPNAGDYLELARVASEAIKRAAPDEAIIGPAMARLDFPLLEEYFRGGVLQYFDAVSVHPYRDSAPDTVAADYAKIRALIEKYQPKNKEIPILAGEWGYTSGAGRWTDEQQARYLARMWLTNLASDVPLSIWYDWRDDGDDPAQSEHRYGMVKRAHFPGRTPAFDAKPAYLAAQNLIRELRGFQFEKRLPAGSPNDWVLQFRRGNDLKIAAWTSEKSKNVSIPIIGNFSVADVLGKSQSQIAARNGVLSLALSPAVTYLTPQSVAPTAPVAAPVNPRYTPKPTVLAFPFGALWVQGQAPKFTLQLSETDANFRAVSLDATIFDAENRAVHRFETQRALRGNQSATFELPRFGPGLYRLSAKASWSGQSLEMTHHFGVVSRDLASRPTREIPRWVGLNPYIQHMNAQIYPPAFELMNLLGVRHVRWLPGWGNVQPEENRYDWASSDAFIALCRQNDIAAMACLSYWGAPWTHQKAQQIGGAPMGFSAPARQLWVDSFAVPTMRRYGDYVKEWQIWNEPNAFWNDDPAQSRGFARAFGSPANYYDLFSKTHDAGHAQGKNLKIMATLATASQERDLRRLFEFGLARKFDGFIAHSYGNHAGRLTKVRQIMTEFGHGDKSLGSGEIGIPAEEPLSRARQAAFLAEVFLSTTDLKNISGVDWFVLSNRVAEGTYGLLDNRFEPTPSALAYFTTARLLSGATSGTSQTRGNLRLHQIERKGRAPLLALWTNDGSPRQVSLRLKRGEAKIWDLMGRALPVSWRNQRAQVGAAQPIFIEGEVALDEPIELEVAPAPHGVRVRVTSEIAGNATLTLQTPRGPQSRPITLSRGTSEIVFPLSNPQMGVSSDVSAQIQWNSGQTRVSRRLDFALAPRVEAAAANELRRPQNHPFWRVEDEGNWQGLIPDAHKGPQDLSLEIAFGWTPQHLVLWLEARDDIHVSADAGAPWSTDSGQLALDPNYRRSPDAPFVEYAFGLGKDGPIAFAPDAPHYSANLESKREGDKTFYRLMVPWSDLAVAPRAGLPLGASLIVNDNDGPRRKGWLGWGSGIGLSKNPALYRDLVLGEAVTR